MKRNNQVTVNQSELEAYVNDITGLDYNIIQLVLNTFKDGIAIELSKLKKVTIHNLGSFTPAVKNKKRVNLSNLRGVDTSGDNGKIATGKKVVVAYTPAHAIYEAIGTIINKLDSTELDAKNYLEELN